MPSQQIRHLLLSFMATGLLAGGGWSQTVNFDGPNWINTNAGDVFDMHVADLDGDGDTDILTSNYSGSEAICWYENLGEGLFSSKEVLHYSSSGGLSCLPVDLDGDGDLDVLSGYPLGWFANLGNGNFSSLITIDIPGPSWYVWDVYAADLDNDGDMDVLTLDWWNGSVISWHRNHGGWFSGPIPITTSANHTRDIYAADLDDDGDADVLLASTADDKISWYENLGGTFGPQQVITTSADYALDVHAADLDGDGDLDVLSASGYDDDIAWYKNLGGGKFGPKKLIAHNVSYAMRVDTADLNGDGKQDVLFGEGNDNKLAWKANLGDGSFGPKKTISTVMGSFDISLAADLDGDGDTDVLSACNDDYDLGRIVWYENQGPWLDLGFATSGILGEPQLAGSGVPLPGEVLTIELSNALPGSFAILVAGLSQVLLPYKGGVLVPFPDYVMFRRVVPHGGLLMSSDVWREDDPSDFTAIFQYWMVDPGGPQGFSVSNAIAIVVP